MTSIKRSCSLRTLARGPVAHVQRCDSCGCISVHLGAVTVRLDGHAFQSTTAVLREAASRLEADSAPVWPAAVGEA